MAQVTNRRFCDQRKVEIVTIVDDYGAKVILQHPLTQDGYNAEAQEAEVMAMMDNNVARFRKAVESRKKDKDK